MIDIEKAKKAFNNYVDKFDKTNRKISFKIAHTYRVVELSKQIAKNLELNEKQVTLAEIIGLLHDIGRFKQAEKFNTFTDENSIDHADLGVKILKENNFIEQFCEEKRLQEIILKAIKNHNKFKIEEGLNEEELLFSKIIRDADKIDIFYAITTEKLAVLMDETNINNSNISKEVLEDFYNKKQTSRSLLKTPIEEWLSYIGMVYDLNFKYSFEIIKEKDYINKIIDRCNNKEMKNIREFINKYISERVLK